MCKVMSTFKFSVSKLTGMCKRIVVRLWFRTFTSFTSHIHIHSHIQIQNQIQTYARTRNHIHAGAHTRIHDHTGIHAHAHPQTNLTDPGKRTHTHKNIAFCGAYIRMPSIPPTWRRQAHCVGAVKKDSMTFKNLFCGLYTNTGAAVS